MLNEILEFLGDVAVDDKSSADVNNMGKEREDRSDWKKLEEGMFQLDGETQKRVFGMGQDEEELFDDEEGDVEGAFFELGTDEKSLEELEELEDELFGSMLEEDVMEQVSEQKEGLEIIDYSEERDFEDERIDQVGEPDPDEVLENVESEQEIIDRLEDMETKRCPECDSEFVIKVDRCPVCGAKF